MFLYCFVYFYKIQQNKKMIFVLSLKLESGSSILEHQTCLYTQSGSITSC